MKRKMTLLLLVAILAVSVCVMAACNDDKGNPFESAVEEIKQQFESRFIDYCVNIADDWSYVEIDTNPDDYDDFSPMYFNSIVLAFNKALHLPVYIEREMKETNAAMGVCTETVGDIEVSWSYHPDRGMEVIYKYKG